MAKRARYAGVASGSSSKHQVGELAAAALADQRDVDVRWDGRSGIRRRPDGGELEAALRVRLGPPLEPPRPSLVDPTGAVLGFPEIEVAEGVKRL
jgi:hypothetical protein